MGLHRPRAPADERGDAAETMTRDREGVVPVRRLITTAESPSSAPNDYPLRPLTFPRCVSGISGGTGERDNACGCGVRRLRTCKPFGLIVGRDLSPTGTCICLDGRFAARLACFIVESWTSPFSGAINSGSGVLQTGLEIR